MARYEISKLKCYSISKEFALLLHRLPLSEGLNRIIFENEDSIEMNPEIDKRLNGHKVKLFLDKGISPPMIYIHIDNRFAAQYSYFDEAFAERSNVDLDD